MLIFGLFSPLLMSQEKGSKLILFQICSTGYRLLILFYFGISTASTIATASLSLAIELL